MSTPAIHAPRIDDEGVTFSIPDPDSSFTSVNLWQEILRPRPGPAFARPNGASAWRLRLQRPAADRIEYKLELTHRNGTVEVVCDPFNPLRAPGPFGDKSIVEWPNYKPPEWVTESAEAGTSFEVSIRNRALKRELPAIVWTSPGRSRIEPLPLLVVHDGPEYDEFSALTRYLAWATESNRIPPLRVALLKPVDRDETYSASAAYARALAHEVLPALSELAPAPHGRRMRAGMGASLGALAMLHTHRTNPASFGGLFLQSGSFFRQRFDPQESGFARFRRITRFVGRVATDTEWPHPISVSMTCGSAEENLHNNRYTRHILAAQGYDVAWHEHPDAHNWVSWRDTFDPHLARFLLRLWT
jgi:enterochelin esterase-like enzyme